jgi:phage tail-like protein
MSDAHCLLAICGFREHEIVSSENIELAGGSITLRRGRFSKGRVCLRAIDSGESEFVWQRLSLECELPKDTLIRIYARASDDETDTGAQAQPQGVGPDIYLSVAGRYLWLEFELLSGEECPVIHKLRLFLRGDRMADYLPEIYRTGGDFAKRFLAVFDSLVTDLEREIYHITARFDYKTADGAELERLASWVGVDAAGDDGVTRGRIAAALEDYESMFTVEGIRRSVARLTGAAPVIIEYTDVDPNSRDCPDSEIYRRLYGENPYKFFILLDSDTFAGRDDREGFIDRMEGLIPAGMEFEAVMLRHRIRLGDHCYLGLNSYISSYIPAALSGDVNVQHDVIVSD